MKNVRQLALTLALTASAAFANDHLTKIADHARNLATDYRRMADTLKNKDFAPHELKQELQEAEAALSNVKTLLAEYSATGPNLNAAQQKDWQLTQDLVTLLDIFHGSKTELLSEANAQKKRSDIRAHALGLLTRATMLEATVKRLPGTKSNF